MKNKINDWLVTLGILALLYFMNEGLWLFDVTLLIIILPLLVLGKGGCLFVMNAWLRYESSGIRKAIFWIMIVMLLLLGFYNDFVSTVYLLAYRYGTSAHTIPIEYRIKGRGSSFITYEYSVNGITIRNEQYVSRDYYALAEKTNDVEFRYLEEYPTIATLMDKKILKFDTFFSFALFQMLLVGAYPDQAENFLQRTIKFMRKG